MWGLLARLPDTSWVPRHVHFLPACTRRGVRKNVGSANRVPIRGDIHVLVVGDPGLGKSQLLQVGGLYICWVAGSLGGVSGSGCLLGRASCYSYYVGAWVTAG